MRTRIRLLGTTLVMLVASAVIAAGCGSGDSDGGGTDREQRLTMAMATEPSSLDPALIGDVDAAAVAAQVFSGLTKIVGEEAEVVPDMAEGLGELSDDGKTVTYTLRDGLTWSNGDPVTAEDFVWSWLRTLDPDTKAPLSYQMHDIVGAADYNGCGSDKECADLREKVGVTAVDERTIEIKLNNPVPWFDQLPALNVFFPVHRATVEQHKDRWTDAANIVTNGPFEVEDIQKGQSIHLVRNDEHWDADNVALENVELRVVENQAAGYRLFQDQEVDTGFMSSLVGPSDIEEAKTQEEFLSAPQLSVQYMYLNTTAPELEDKRVRQAIALAVDRPKMTDQILKAGQVPSPTVAPAGMPGYEVIETGTQDFIQADAEPDVDRAKQLLEEAGWEEGTTINMYYGTGTESSQLVAESIKEDLAAVGIDLELVPQSDQNTLYAAATPPIDEDVNVIFLGWIADYLDARGFYEPFMCGGGSNATNYCNEEMDELINQLTVELDETARFELEKEVEAMLTGPEGDFPAVPLYSDATITMVQPWVDGLEFTPLGIPDLASVEISDED